MKYFLVLIFLFLSYLLKARQTPDTIAIRATTSVSGKEYFIDIIRNEVQTDIRLRVKLYELKKFDKDKNLKYYRELGMSVKQMFPLNDTLKLCMQKIDSIKQTYTKYKVDSLLINREEIKDYDVLIDSIFKSGNDVLENKIANRNRIVLDGTGIAFVLKENDSMRKVYAQSPTRESHPLLARLLAETKSLLRTTTSN